MFIPLFRVWDFALLALMRGDCRCSIQIGYELEDFKQNGGHAGPEGVLWGRGIIFTGIIVHTVRDVR